MESQRLTYRGNNGKGYVRNQGYYAKVYLNMAEVAERLTAYEDTAFGPREIKSLEAEWNACRMALDSYRALGTPEQFRAALRRTAEYDKAREAGMFKPGSSVYVVERDECGEAAGVSGYMFLAVSGKGAILSFFINGMEGLEDTIGEHIVETAENMSTDLYVYPIEDVYSTRQEAEAALGGGDGD